MFRGEINTKGRPIGSTNRITSEVKELINQLASDLFQSIDVNELKATDKVRLFTGILPYIIPKKAEIDATINSNLTWLDEFTEKELEKILNK
jgi:hypothetical protein